MWKINVSDGLLVICSWVSLYRFFFYHTCIKIHEVVGYTKPALFKLTSNLPFAIRLPIG